MAGESGEPLAQDNIYKMDVATLATLNLPQCDVIETGGLARVSVHGDRGNPQYVIRMPLSQRRSNMEPFAMETRLHQMAEGTPIADFLPTTITLKDGSKKAEYIGPPQYAQLDQESLGKLTPEQRFAIANQLIRYTTLWHEKDVMIAEDLADNDQKSGIGPTRRPGEQLPRKADRFRVLIDEKGQVVRVCDIDVNVVKQGAITELEDQLATQERTLEQLDHWKKQSVEAETLLRRFGDPEALTRSFQTAANLTREVQQIQDTVTAMEGELTNLAQERERQLEVARGNRRKTEKITRDFEKQVQDKAKELRKQKSLLSAQKSELMNIYPQELLYHIGRLDLSRMDVPEKKQILEQLQSLPISTLEEKFPNYIELLRTLADRIKGHRIIEAVREHQSSVNRVISDTQYPSANRTKLFVIRTLAKDWSSMAEVIIPLITPHYDNTPERRDQIYQTLIQQLSSASVIGGRNSFGQNTDGQMRTAVINAVYNCTQEYNRQKSMLPSHKVEISPVVTKPSPPIVPATAPARTVPQMTVPKAIPRTAEPAPVKPLRQPEFTHFEETAIRQLIRANANGQLPYFMNWDQLDAAMGTSQSGTFYEIADLPRINRLAREAQLRQVEELSETDTHQFGESPKTQTECFDYIDTLPNEEQSQMYDDIETLTQNKDATESRRIILEYTHFQRLQRMIRISRHQQQSQ